MKDFTLQTYRRHLNIQAFIFANQMKATSKKDMLHIRKHYQNCTNHCGLEL